MKFLSKKIVDDSITLVVKGDCCFLKNSDNDRTMIINSDNIYYLDGSKIIFNHFSNMYADFIKIKDYFGIITKVKDDVFFNISTNSINYLLAKIDVYTCDIFENLLIIDYSIKNLKPAVHAKIIDIKFNYGINKKFVLYKNQIYFIKYSCSTYIITDNYNSIDASFKDLIYNMCNYFSHVDNSFLLSKNNLIEFFSYPDLNITIYYDYTIQKHHLTTMTFSDYIDDDLLYWQVFEIFRYIFNHNKSYKGMIMQMLNERGVLFFDTVNTDVSASIFQLTLDLYDGPFEYR